MALAGLVEAMLLQLEPGAAISARWDSERGIRILRMSLPAGLHGPIPDAWTQRVLQEAGVKWHWADQALAEFFAQGDLEREANLPISPLCDRKTTDLATSQRDFIQFVVLPSFKVLGQIFPGIGDEVLPGISENLGYWESRCVSSKNVLR